MSRTIDEFRRHRQHANERIFELGNRNIKRFFNLDTNAYREGVLDVQTKEMLGLVASMVLRCNDCIDYHVDRCVEEGLSDEQLMEAMNVALIVGGSIVIPHLRHAVGTLDELRGRE